jgi:transcriptional regulator with XRE-family HTH domain
MVDKLGEVIRNAREAKGMTLRRLEAAVGVSNAHLSQLETGRIERPSMALLFALAEALDLDYPKLLRLGGHTTAGNGASRAVPGVAFRDSDDLTPEEADEVLRFIDMLKKRRP